MAAWAGHQQAPVGRRTADLCPANGHYLRSLSQSHFQDRASEPWRTCAVPCRGFCGVGCG